MERSSPAQLPPCRPSHQLPLPLEAPLARPTPSRPTITLTLRQVWASLSPSLQAQVRQTLLRVMQEIVRDGQQ